MFPLIQQVSHTTSRMSTLLNNNFPGNERTHFLSSFLLHSINLSVIFTNVNDKNERGI